MGRRLQTLKRAGAIWVPVLACFIVVGFIVEVTHVSQAYSNHYRSPVSYVPANVVSEYSANSVKGKWEIFGLDGSAGVAFRTVPEGHKGGVERTSVVDAHGSAQATPAMAWGHGAQLGVWVGQTGSNDQPLRAAYFQHGHVSVVSLTHSGFVEHPYPIADPRGGFDVLFGWQRGNYPFAIYGMRVVGPGVHEKPALIARSPVYGLNPIGAWDGRQHLDVLFLEECCRNAQMNLIEARLDADLTPTSRPGLLDRFATSPPQQWGMDMKSGSDGSVWAAWEGNTGISLAKWNSDGGLLFKRRIVPASFDTSAPSLSLLLSPPRGDVYYTLQGPLGWYVQQTQFDSGGRLVSSQRVSYDSGGDAENPRAALSHGVPSIVWEKLGAGQTGVEVVGTRYRPSVAPSLSSRLGLDSGNPFVDLLMLTAGALMAAIPLTFINALFVVPLLLIWLPISLVVPERLRWFVYIAVVSLVMALVFVARTFASHWTFVVGSLGWPVNLAAVVAAVFVGVWISRVGMGDQDNGFRVAALTISAFYFISAMSALALLETHLTLI